MAQKPKTIEQKLKAREVYTFHKGTLKNKKAGREIVTAGLSVRKNGLSTVKWYNTPFTKLQAREICSVFGYVFSYR